MEAVADLLFDIPKNYGLAFDVVHYIVCLQGERADLGEGFETFTRSNPLVCNILSYFLLNINVQDQFEIYNI